MDTFLDNGKGTKHKNGSIGKMTSGYFQLDISIILVPFFLVCLFPFVEKIVCENQPRGGFAPFLTVGRELIQQWSGTYLCWRKEGGGNFAGDVARHCILQRRASQHRAVYHCRHVRLLRSLTTLVPYPMDWDCAIEIFECLGRGRVGCATT